MVETIFSSDLGQMILLFLLIFTVVFAILQKSKILGDGKKQIDALVALAIGLLVTSVGYVLDFAQKLFPFMAVVLIVILVFMILLAMFYDGKIEMHKYVRMAFGIVVFIVVMIAVLIFTDGWTWVKNWFNEGNISANVILLIVVVLVVLFAYFGKDRGGGKPSE